MYTSVGMYMLYICVCGRIQCKHVWACTCFISVYVGIYNVYKCGRVRVRVLYICVCGRIQCKHVWACTCFISVYVGIYNVYKCGRVHSLYMCMWAYTIIGLGSHFLGTDFLLSGHKCSPSNAIILGC